MTSGEIGSVFTLGLGLAIPWRWFRPKDSLLVFICTNEMIVYAVLKAWWG